MEENGLTLAPILCDGMVLQRDAVNRIYGTETKAETVTVFFMNSRFSVPVDENSDFCVELPPVGAGGPCCIKIIGSREITINNILFGDVYILSGQSNMELPVRRVLDVSEEEIRDTCEPCIRQYHIPATYNFLKPEKFMYAGQWKKAMGKDLMDFSAAGYFFAKEIMDAYHVPIGLILTAVGGSRIEAWMNLESLKRFGDYEKEIEQFKNLNEFQNFLQKQQQLAREWESRIENAEAAIDFNRYKEWDTCRVPSLVSDYGTVFTGSVYLCREIILNEDPEKEEAFLYMGSIIDADWVWINGEPAGYTQYRYPPRKYPIKKGLLKKGANRITIRILINKENGGTVRGKPYYLRCKNQIIDLAGEWYYRVGKKAESKRPEVLFPPALPVCFYNTAAVPLSKIEIKGILWYQGESNTDTPWDYAQRFSVMASDWRRLYGRDLPFIFVQLANYREPLNDLEDTGWAELREQQRQNLSLPNTAMAVALDIGEYNDLHPQNKKELGRRLARAAEYLIYKNSCKEKSKHRIISEDRTFYNGPLPEDIRLSGSRVVIRFRYLEDTKEEYVLNNFELADKEGIYHAASAIRRGRYVTVSISKDDTPTAVRYAWRDNPENINFYNEERLPAPGFRLFVSN